MLNFKQPVTTRGGNKVKLYEVFTNYMIGAWFNEQEERWVPCTWTMPNGFFLHEKHPRGLDLINEEYYEPQTA